jgi:hypothetical protein
VLSLTLDTSFVIHAVQRQDRAALMDQLVDAARGGRVELWLTTAFDRDQETAPPAHAEANRRWIENSPIRDVVPGPARWDYSVWDGPDVLVDEEYGSVDEALRRVVLPRRLWAESMTDQSALSHDDVRHLHDLQHLAAHRLAGHDAFITSDVKDILRKRDVILAETGITCGPWTRLWRAWRGQPRRAAPGEVGLDGHGGARPALCAEGRRPAVARPAGRQHRPRRLGGPPRDGKVTLRAYATSWEAVQVSSEGTRRIVDNALRLHVLPTRAPTG